MLKTILEDLVDIVVMAGPVVLLLLMWKWIEDERSGKNDK